MMSEERKFGIFWIIQYPYLMILIFIINHFFMLTYFLLLSLPQILSGAAFQPRLRSPCNKSTNIASIGNRLCHYSSLNGEGYSTSTWLDLSGNDNHLIHNVNMFNLVSYYGSSEDYVRNLDNSGHIIFPTECNLPSDGDYTLITASMYYGPVTIGGRAFGNCNDDTFISGWYQSGDHGTYGYQLSIQHDNRGIYQAEGFRAQWVIVSDTLNSVRVNSENKTEIGVTDPPLSNLGNDVQICLNYRNGTITNGPYRIKEYIVFNETLSDEDQRCVEEYIFDKHPFWQGLTQLASYNIAPTSNATNTPSTSSPTFQISYSDHDNYILVHGSMNWTDGEAYCVHNFGTHLASIHSECQNIEAANLCLECWLGLNDRDQERGSNKDGWEWSDGTPFDYNGGFQGINEPSGHGGENCVHIGFGGQALWNDYGCDSRRRLLCNRYPSTTNTCSYVFVSLISDAVSD